ncbi:hypothetical protein C10C_0254 [Chlamydia serpentis]|uniref:Uncharacterized protein n=1 Tax=Chlamydia serpentis TaxID=1967782 RepID=A0A2R8FAH9_9CHLA|nr:hypothetical protein [Chlamydia serpentis]SPN73428.1 hypothetical protein C10C_0254 [Chlamydia serpentis]
MSIKSSRITTIDDATRINLSNNYSCTLKNSLKPLAYLLLAVLAAGLLVASLYFCTLISGSTVLLAMLITLSICSVLCVIYLFHQQSSREKTKVFSINNPSIFFSEETLNLLLGHEEETDINKLLKNFELNDYRRPRMFLPSSFLNEQGRPSVDRVGRITYFQKLVEGVVNKIKEFSKTPPKMLPLLMKFANKDLANSSVSVLYEGLLSVLNSPGEEILEMLFSLDRNWIKSVLHLDKTFTPSKEDLNFVKVIKYYLASPETRVFKTESHPSMIDFMTLKIQNINTLISAICLRSSHDRSKAFEIIQKFCPHFSIEEVKQFIEQRNILAPLLNYILEGEENSWLGPFSLNLETIASTSLYPEPSPSCWKSINHVDYAKNTPESQEVFNKTKESCKLALKKLVPPQLSIRSVGQILNFGNYKKGLGELKVIQEEIRETPFLVLEALLESEDFVLSLAKYLKLLMPLDLWEKFFYMVYSGYFQTGLICQGEVNTFCSRTQLDPEALQIALQQGKLLSFLFPKIYID